MYREHLKRTFDLLAAVVAIPVAAVPGALVAIAIFVEDRGPVFYVSQRRGKDGKHFAMYKFRSMKVDAPDLRNPDLSTINSDSDTRVTRVGRIIRKTSLDELPQLINVLLGDMSIIGPRPNMTRQKYEELTDVERERIEVRPGITGYSQALFRNSISAEEKYALDVHYVRNVSLALDLQILGKTVTSVLGQRGINSTQSHGSSDK